ncbi:MAG: class I SAM-dependent methyltransferase, partial [Anaerolineae bacterium]|nr:class I SAM-dependent methyltransferase [Anaerolineae bacterium]
LFKLWRLNFRLGWPERARGLHYWLGYEYALALDLLDLPPGARLLDVGTGAYSTFPYLLTHLRGPRVVASDIAPGIQRQRQIRRRAIRAGRARPRQVRLLQADARHLPLASASFDAVTALSTLEHVRGLHGDRQALQEIARVVRPGGAVLLTLPFRAYGTLLELDDRRQLYQRHFSNETLWTSLLQPSGLVEEHHIYYRERLPFYRLYRRLPRWLTWLHRPWDTLLSYLLLEEVTNPAAADAILVLLRRP